MGTWRIDGDGEVIAGIHGRVGGKEVGKLPASGVDLRSVTAGCRWVQSRWPDTKYFGIAAQLVMH